MKYSNLIFAFGKHAVAEAVRYKPSAVKEVLFSHDLVDNDLKNLVRTVGIAVGSFDPTTPPKALGEGAVHQGVVAKIAVDELTLDYGDFLANLTVNADTAVVVLGEVEDPQNVGAIIRSAAAFGLAGVLIPRHNQAPITGAVVKVSAGMAFRIPLIEIGNVNTTLRDLKEKGFWVYGLAGAEGNNVHDEVFDAPAVFVVGNEGRGLREKTKEASDIVLSIPMHERCESLNAAASTTVVLSSWSRQHQKALEG